MILPGRCFAVYGCTEGGAALAKHLKDALHFRPVVFVDEAFSGESYAGCPVVDLSQIEQVEETEIFVLSEPGDRFVLGFIEKAGFYSVNFGNEVVERLGEFYRLFTEIEAGNYFSRVRHDGLPCNPSSRLTRAVAAGGGAWDGVKVVDIGTRDGVNRRWLPFDAGPLKIIGFEPDAEECRALNRHRMCQGGTGEEIRGDLTFYPVALWSSKGTRTLYDTLFPYSSGLCPFGPGFFLDRFAGRGHLQPHGQFAVECTSFKDFTRDHAVADAWDYVKIDTEGAELDILKGFGDCLESVLAVESEFSLNPAFRDCPTFQDLDRFMNAQGFTLYDMWVQRYPRLPLGYDRPLTPVLKEKIRHDHVMTSLYNREDAGQAMTGDAVYFRDPIPALKAGDTGFWTKSRLLRQMCLFESYQLNDCAMEILDHASCFGAEEKNAYRELLVPPLADGSFLSHADFLRVQELAWNFANGRLVPPEP